MNCWQCKYFKTPYTEKPCLVCLDNCEFVLWCIEEDKENEEKPE